MEDGVEGCDHWIEIVWFGVLNNVNTIVVEVSENGKCYMENEDKCIYFLWFHKIL